MKSKTTLIWFALAAGLLAFIWFYEKHLKSGPPVKPALVSGLRAADATAISVVPAGAREISVLRTNGAWLLQKPVAYPAQAAAVEALIETLEKTVPALRLGASEVSGDSKTDADFGFANPQFSIVLTAGEKRWQLLVGNRTAPGDQVFVRVVGETGVFVTDAAWLQLLPSAADAWRDTALLAAAGSVDWILVTNGARTLEFRRDSTSQLWRMTKPLQTSADSLRINAALEKLRAASARSFVTDDPKTDLSTYGLQPSALSIQLGRGTNIVAAVHAGKSPAEDSGNIFARREGWNSVVTAPSTSFEPWRGAVNDFRDRALFTLSATPVAEVEFRGTNNFTLRRGTNGWSITGEKFTADADNIHGLIEMLAAFRITEFVKDVVTPADLKTFGLDAPARQITLRSVPGSTNAPLVQLLFGTVETNRVFVKCAGSDFIYALSTADTGRLPESGWEFRNRRIWNFAVTNVAQVTLKQRGKVRQIVREGANSWSLAPGSQGIITPPAVEETLHRLGELTAVGWVGRAATLPEEFRFLPENLQIIVELKSGEKFTIDFGGELAQTALAAVTLDGERWAFVFPPPLFQLVAAYLTIPPNTP